MYCLRYAKKGKVFYHSKDTAGSDIMCRYSLIAMRIDYRSRISPVDIQLVLLVVVGKAPPGFVDGQMSLLGVVQHVVVVLPRDLGLDLDRLALVLRLADGARVGPAAIAATLPQAGLNPSVPSLEAHKTDGGSGGKFRLQLHDLFRLLLH